MPPESEIHYFCKPAELRPVALPVEFLGMTEFLTDEPACQALWEFASTQFRTRRKFLTVWQTVQHVVLHRDGEGQVDGLLLVTAPINWQIDYVVVRPDARGQGIAGSLVTAAVNQAYLLGVPYVMLTSKESLRSLYESCGFEVIRSGCPA